MRHCPAPLPARPWNTPAPRTRRRHRAAVAVGGLGLCLLAGRPLLAQDMELEIRQSGRRTVPTAIAHFREPDGRDVGGVGSTLRTVLQNDLTFSGIFVVRDYPPPAQGHDLAAAKLKGLQCVILGEYRREGDTVVWEVRAFDVAFDRQVVGKRYRGRPAGLRTFAHTFADEVVQAYTGKRGVAMTQIAFLSLDRGAKELYFMDYDGANPRQITRLRDLVLAPAWAPDATELYYTSYHAGNPDLYRVTLATGAFERVAGYNGLNTAAAVSPDGRELALALSRDGNTEVYVMTLATKRLRRLTFSSGVDTQPSWSPNGQELAFVSDRGGSPQVFIMDREGADVRRISYGVGYTTSPVWSPQGDRIAFVGLADGVFQLMTVTPRGSGLVQLTSGTANSEDPSWAPDGRHLAYSRSANKQASEIWVIRGDGTGARRVSKRGVPCTGPAWSPYR